MTLRLHGLCQRLRRFSAADDGMATVEAMLWVPLFVFLTVLIVNVSMVFNAQSRAQRIVHDINRAFAVGRILTETEAETQLRTRIAAMSPSASVDSRIEQGIVISVVRMPVEELSMLRSFAPLRGYSIVATSQQLLEN